ncbi:endonuclease V [Candidatus Bathyarchaeota archaeon]|nr:MAG: endonuclease V [Candidatus Bathyarchaeota archaeon]
MTTTLPIERLRNLQKNIATKTITEDFFERPLRRVAGADVAYSNSKAYAAIVITELPSFKVIEETVYVGRPPIPYIPGLLAFREGPLILKTLKNVRNRFQVLLINGHGIAHPLRCGLATYVGVLAGKPTVGVAGKLLIGRVLQQPKKPLEYTPIQFEGNVVGYCLKPRGRGKPIYVSPGHLVSLDGALDVAIASLGRYRMPEPLRLAHLAANQARRSDHRG